MIDIKIFSKIWKQAIWSTEYKVDYFREAPTSNVIQEPKPLTGTEEVNQHVSDLQHIIGAYSVVNTPKNLSRRKNKFKISSKTRRKLHQIFGLFNK